MANLPLPDSFALEHSKKLLEVIRQEIVANKGKISFSRYMQLALYAPGLGYYSAGLTKLGEKGDFVTAPEISPLFAQCLAQQCLQVLSMLKQGQILEFGAGTGIMAAELLKTLERQNSLPEKYLILEISAELRQRQQQLLQKRLPHLFDRIEWIDSLPKNFSGIVIANEILDAMPVDRFRIDQQVIHEFYVGFDGENLIWQLDKANSNLQNNITGLQIERTGDFYDSEINSLLSPWIASVSDCLTQGLVLLIDYGFPRAEYYHPDRSMGTLMCHYRHFAHTDPLILTGLQDITAHVDFTAVAEAAAENQLKVAGFTSQAAFLLSCGLLDLVQSSSTLEQIKLSQQIQKLTSPNEMGELFKVMALTKGLDEVNLQGFALQDQRHRL